MNTTEQELYDVLAQALNKYIAIGVKAKEIAEVSGLSVSTIRKFASHNTTYPRMHTVYAILGYFGYELQLHTKGKSYANHPHVHPQRQGVHERNRH